jgi:hypothetical protein
VRAHRGPDAGAEKERKGDHYRHHCRVFEVADGDFPSGLSGARGTALTVYDSANRRTCPGSWTCPR